MTDPDHGPVDPEQPQGPTIRDRRRIDPETGQVREPQAAAAPGPGAPEAQPGPVTDPGAVAGTVDDLPAAPAAPASTGDVPVDPEPGDVEGDDRVAQLEQALLERTQDLQRLQAEYVNYKRRVDRDRELSRGQGVESVLRDLLGVLDDLRSAREHGELTGAFKAVGEAVEKVTAKQGLVVFGEAGEAFDPVVHEALMHSYSEDVTEPTCVQILQPGYRLGGKVLRPARVAVAEPSAPAAGGTDPGPA